MSSRSRRKSLPLPVLRCGRSSTSWKTRSSPRSATHQEVVSRVCGLTKPYRGTYTKATGPAVRRGQGRVPPDVAGRRARRPRRRPRNERTRRTDEQRDAVVDTLVPAELVPFLPYRTLNQAQAEVVPEILGHDQNLLVVAPTGAGKTMIGMVAALRAVVQQGRKAAWLVPQRSLADELDRELETLACAGAESGAALRRVRHRHDAHQGCRHVGGDDGEVRGPVPDRRAAGVARRGRGPSRGRDPPAGRRDPRARA